MHIVAAAREEALASISRHVESFVRLELAHTLLSCAIDRYSEQNRDPVLERASEIFQRITLGSFYRLEVGFEDGDRQILCCVRNDERRVGVGDLSAGTRDQLYLALRLASLSRRAKGSEPIPLILDDVLIHFDDDRARATLEVLSEIATTSQILFFTHHTRLREQARAVVSHSILAEHEL